MSSGYTYTKEGSSTMKFQIFGIRIAILQVGFKVCSFSVVLGISFRFALSLYMKFYQISGGGSQILLGHYFGCVVHT